MTLPTFSQLLSEYMNRLGISDTELARSIGVRRQTIFRWKEGLVERPRSRDDVMRCAQKLRLTPEERDLLLLAAGFAPETLAPDRLTDLVEETVAKDEPATKGAQPVATTAPAMRDAELDETAPGNDVTNDEITNKEIANREIASDIASEDEGDDEVTGAATVEDASPTTEVAPASVGAQVVTLASPALHNAAHSTPEQSAQAVDLPLTKFDLAARQLSVSDEQAPAHPLLARLPGRRWAWWPVAPALLVLVILGLVWTRMPFTQQNPAVTPVTTPDRLKITPGLAPTVLSNTVILPVASPGQSMLLVAQFKGYTANERFNVAGRIQEALQQQIEAAHLVSTTVEIWPEEMRGSAHVAQVLATAHAALLIWGEYDSGRVQVNLALGDGLQAQNRDFPLTSSDELVTTINSTVPSEIRLVALTAFGRFLRSQKEYAQATAAFERALKLQPANPNTKALLNFYLGTVAEQDHSLAAMEQAIGYYARAIALNDRLYDARYNRGTVLLNRAYILPAGSPLITQSLDAAIADLTKVIDFKADYLKAYLNRGIAYYERDGADDMAAAIQDFSHILAVEPENYMAYFHRGLAYIRAGEPTAWQVDFQKVLELNPAYAQAYNGLCWGYALAQAPETALPFCDEAVTHDPTGASHDSRALVYVQLDRYADAVADFQAYLHWIETLQPPALYERYRGTLVTQWVEQLDKGGNPFDEALLAALRRSVVE
ncbi:MAG: hypothetical protein R3C14_44310 [Caldilineaceae bacterium]